MEEGLVSVIMPVWNSAATLPVALRSIQSQSYERWECIVLDDGSTDRSVEIAAGFGDDRIRVVGDGDHRGLAARLNQGVRLARGEFVARMDADDVSYPHRFEAQVTALQNARDLDLTGSWVVVFRNDGDVFGKRTSPMTHEELFTLIGAVQIPHPTFLGRTTWFRRFPYVASTSGFEDQFLLLQSWSKSRFHVLPEVLLGYREDDLTLKKQFRYRGAYFKAHRDLASALGWPRTIVLLIAQAAKMVLDAIAVITGAQHALLRKRARPIEPEERRRWEEVWERVSRT